MTLVLVALATLAATPDLGVVIGKRSGVSAPVAMERAAAVRAALGPDSAAAPIEDFTECASKRPCLVSRAQPLGWKALIVVETATILSDSLVKVTVLSVDDDGREVANTSVQVPDDQLVAALSARFERVRAEVARLLPVAKPPPTSPTKTEPITSVVPVTPPSVEPPRVDVSPPPGGRPMARWLPAAGGVLLVGGGAIFFGLSRGMATRLETEVFVDAETPTGLARQGATFQTLGVALLVSGGVVTLGGVVLALLWPEATVAPVAVFTPHGASFGVSGRLP